MYEKGDINYWIVVVSFIMPLVVSAIFIWFMHAYQKKKNQHELDLVNATLREQKLLLEQQKAIEDERIRIAAEMHDDLGGGLTNIRYLSQNLLNNIPEKVYQDQAKKIMDHAQELVFNMSEIIWAMNSGFDTMESLIAYSRRYVTSFLEDQNIKVKVSILGDIENIPLSGETRRNIFLIIKEATHNAVKHSRSNNFSLVFEITDALKVELTDYGIGMKELQHHAGNGFINMQKRALKLGGNIQFVTNDAVGLKIILTIPLEKKSIPL